MAPEQITGEHVDARADLFAFGVILYDVLTGQHPFRRPSVIETLQAGLTVDPADVTALTPQVPATLGRIVMRLLDKTAAARFQSAADLLWALEQVDLDRGSASQPRLSRSVMFAAAVAVRSAGVAEGRRGALLRRA